MAYLQKEWLDHIVEYPNRVRVVPSGDGVTYKLDKDEGELIQQGTPVTANNMNRIEKGVADAHTGVSDLRMYTATLAVQVATLQGATLGGVGANIFIEDLADLTGTLVTRGVYDPENRKVYC